MDFRAQWEGYEKFRLPFTLQLAQRKGVVLHSLCGVHYITLACFLILNWFGPGVLYN